MYIVVRTNLPAGAFKMKKCDIAENLRTCQLFHCQHLTTKMHQAHAMGQSLCSMLGSQSSLYTEETNMSTGSSQFNAIRTVTKGHTLIWELMIQAWLVNGSKLSSNFHNSFCIQGTKPVNERGQHELFQAYAKWQQLAFCRWSWKKKWIPLWVWGVGGGKDGRRQRSPGVEQPWAERQRHLRQEAAPRTHQFLKPPCDLERKQHTF